MPDRIQWEYTTLNMIKKEFFNKKERIRILNKMGEMGWEMVCFEGVKMFPEGATEYDDERAWWEHEFTFKRLVAKKEE